MENKNSIALIGFMGSGKSTVAKGLKKLFGYKIIEMDSLIEKREGIKIPEIFESKGEEYFRGLETGLLKELSDTDACIISCGGGVVLRQENVDIIKEYAKIVLLRATPQTILERVKNSHNRPLLENNKSIDFISDMMEKRREKYEAAADIIIDTDNKSVDDICREIEKKRLID